MEDSETPPVGGVMRVPANRFARKRFPIELYSAVYPSRGDKSSCPVGGGIHQGFAEGANGQAHNTISGIF